MTQIADERWRDIPGLPDYQASTFGNVRSLDRVKINIRGIPRRLRGQPLKPWLRSGYLQVEIMGKTHDVHRLVLETFVGPCPRGFEGAHWDGLRSNCRLENLRWATRLENTNDRRRHGGLLFSPRKLTRDDVVEIRNIGISVPVPLTAEQFDISEGHVRAIINGRSWREH